MAVSRCVSVAGLFVVAVCVLTPVIYFARGESTTLHCGTLPSTTSDCVTLLRLSERKRVSRCGEIRDIRVFEGDEPTRVGVNLMKGQWLNLLKFLCQKGDGVLSENVRALKIGNVLDIRKYVGPKPTIVGVTLDAVEAKVLTASVCDSGAPDGLREGEDRRNLRFRNSLHERARFELLCNKSAIRSIIVSLQGTQSLEKAFIVKELGVYYPETGAGASYFFKPPDSTLVNASVDRFLASNIHGMEFSHGELPYAVLPELLVTLTKGRCAFAKGLVQCKFLQSEGVRDVHNLEDIDTPKASQLPDVSVNCHIPGHSTNPFCGQRQARKFGLYVLDYISK